jgi:hypothetical protein
VRVEPVLQPCSAVVADGVAGLAPELVLAPVVEHVAAAHVVVAVALVELAGSAAAEVVATAVDAFGLAHQIVVA